MSTVVEIRGISYRYHSSGIYALRDVSLKIDDGESVGLIGPNGAGKTTLLHHMNGLLTGTGEVRVFGKPLSSAHKKEIRTKVGLIFQDPDDQLFMPTVFDDVSFGPLNMGLDAEEVRKRVAAALSRVGLSGLGDRAPHHLSGGEKRRVAIASVLAMGPRFLVMDEPSGNLDPRGRRELIDLLRGLEMTKLIASHDLELIGRTCERCILMDGGRIVEDGPSAELLEREELLAAHGLV